MVPDNCPPPSRPLGRSDVAGPRIRTTCPACRAVARRPSGSSRIADGPSPPSTIALKCDTARTRPRYSLRFDVQCGEREDALCVSHHHSHHLRRGDPSRGRKPFDRTDNIRRLTLTGTHRRKRPIALADQAVSRQASEQHHSSLVIKRLVIDREIAAKFYASESLGTNNNRDYPVRNARAFRRLLGQTPPDLEALRAEFAAVLSAPRRPSAVDA